MSRVIAVVACGLTLAACAAAMPSLDFLKSSPPTETLRIESEPPGADARTSQGQTCRTPCELIIPGGGEVSVTVALNGYQPQTVSLRSERPDGARDGDSSAGGAKLSPNPLYVELAAVAPTPAGKKRAPIKRKKPATAAAQPTAPQSAPPPEPTSSVQYPWPSR
jgi:hypothetical protein